MPGICVLRKAGTLHPHDAESLASRRLHHNPALQSIHDLSAQCLQARHFSRDVVSLNIQVDATVVVYALDLHDRLVGRLPGWSLSTGRPSASLQKRAASSTSEVLQSINMAHRRERCIFTSSHAELVEISSLDNSQR